MSGFTKQAIQASFLKLLDTYPLRDITVRMITEDCGINRKSFYYHDQDIPALLEQILADQAAALVASYQSVRSLEECLSAVLEKLIANKRRVQNIYCSVNRDVFESALMQVCGYLTGLYVDSAAQSFAISAQDRELVAGFYRGECFGLIMDWVMRGMPDNVLAYFHQLCTLRQGTTEHLLRRIHTGVDDL